MELGGWFESDQEEFYDDVETKTLELRDWQREAKEFFYDNNHKAIFQVSTGAGKTFSAIDIISEVLERDPKIKVLVVVPKNVILETGWYKEFTDFGFPIQDIGVFYGSVKEYARITITNMQSIDKIPIEIFDFCVFDEVHNMATKRLEPYVFHDFKYKLGLSATLQRLDNRHYVLLKAFNYNVYNYTPEQALTEGVLNPFDFYNIGVELDSLSMQEYTDLSEEIRSVIKTGGSYEAIMRSNDPLKFKLLSLSNKRKTLVNNYEKKFLLLQKIIRRHKNDKVIIFNQYNEQTSKLFWWLIEEDVRCRVFHSGVSKRERDEVLTDFKNDRFNVLLTSKVLDEGYNLPKLDVAIIMAGDSTDKQTIQRMGRVLRKKKGRNSVLYQLFCIDTIEQTQGEKRAARFKKLSSSYFDYHSKEGELYLE